MLMSFALPKYVVLSENKDEIERMRIEYGEEEVEQLCAIGETGHFYDMFKFAQHIRKGVRNMNRVIDRMWYPEPSARASNMKHRPIGIGVQGLADVFGLLEIPWESTEASWLNREIFSTMYRAALRGSMECAKIDGPYESYAGSPASKGIFQPELWSDERAILTLRYAKEGERANMFLEPNFEANLIESPLKEEIAKYGLRNSLLIAPMPTATTAQILGNNECFEPFTSNMYTRATGAGDFIVYNKHMVHSLKKRGLWDTPTRDAIYASKGSVQDIPWIPDDVKAVYKTVWEIKQSLLIRMAAERAPYIDQSMSLNLHIASPTRATLNSLHFLAWRNKLKTGSYYIRRLAESSATSFNSVSLGARPAEALVKSITKRKHDETVESSNGNGHGKDEQAEMKKARIVGACPLNSAVGETDASACEACSG
jgi:ribonucleotide reductase alpha subunit